MIHLSIPSFPPRILLPSPGEAAVEQRRRPFTLFAAVVAHASRSHRGMKASENSIDDCPDGDERLQPILAVPARERDDLGCLKTPAVHVDEHGRGELLCVTNYMSGETK